ncbi:MAG: hypothetical protein ACRDRV_21195 [Pseudonocardiaceae bacterium]
MCRNCGHSWDQGALPFAEPEFGVEGGVGRVTLRTSVTFARSCTGSEPTYSTVSSVAGGGSRPGCPPTPRSRPLRRAGHHRGPPRAPPPGPSAAAATELLRGSGRASETIILITFDTDDHVLRAAAGASGFVLKDTPPADIVQAVRRVAAGELILSPAVTAG